ncbi:MAG TPA: hypothetical protein PK054_04535 [Anaerohalosphaeraceae bacterium]|nr:hypothetical protein [Anaerohalosphaeraceae bacterium]HPP55831.1 hypothetical protein [Anaerohalosphaeraceae bacterium]
MSGNLLIAMSGGTTCVMNAALVRVVRKPQGGYREARGMAKSEVADGKRICSVDGMP